MGLVDRLIFSEMDQLGKETIEQYLVTEIGGTPGKVVRISEIIYEIAERTSNSTIDRVRGDGNCLIRVILRYMRRHTPQLLTNVLITLFEMAGRDIIFPQFDGNRLTEDAYDDVVCGMIRELIVKKWDYKGDPVYHMNEEAIDGLAIHMVMRLLGVSKLSVYQAFDGAGRKHGWRDTTLGKDETLFHRDIQGITIILMTLNGCHYTAIV
jgi:hypothetical protein